MTATGRLPTVGSSVYESFPRKYRPARWDDLVGQRHAVEVLTASIVKDRVFPCYIFAGTAGSGKTSAARIFAMALNCESVDHSPGEDGPAADSVEPCLTCTSCTEALRQRNPDILEIDGASHGTVDHVRDLKEKALYAPQGERRVFIIDEVHSLSRDAFQALLKLLEEPPSHVVFILATTNPERIPATIQSRSIQLDFRRHTERDILKRLHYVCSQEHISAEASALILIARYADGSLRDSLTVLDQLNTAHEGEKVTDELVSQVLGIISSTELADIMSALLEKDAKALEDRIYRMLERTTEFASIVRAITDWYRDVLRVKYGAPQYMRRTESEQKLLTTFSRAMELQALEQALRVTWEMSERVRFSSANPRTFFLTGLYRLLLLNERAETSLPPQSEPAGDLPAQMAEVTPPEAPASTIDLEAELRRLGAGG